VRVNLCDRGAMSFLATTRGISGDDVRDLMVAATEHRFGRVHSLPVSIEWPSDNGSCYIAGDNRSFARDIGLEPRTTPIESPRSNGMAEAFVHTIKRDYVRVSPRPNVVSVMHQLPSWIAHYNVAVFSRRARLGSLQLPDFALKFRFVLKAIVAG
jgi:putative transposase